MESHPPTLQDARIALQTGAVDNAREISKGLLETDPSDAEALYLLAVCERYMGNTADARDALNDLLDLQPRYGRAHQESGHLYRSLGETPEAVAAFREAIRYNPALLASWVAITELAEKDAALFLEAKEQVSRLSALPKELLSVRSMIHEGKLLKAEKLCRAFMQKHPKHVEGMRLLADLAVRFEVLDDAEFLLESALEFEPDNLFARFDYVNVLYRRQNFARSLAEAQNLLARDPDNASYKSVFANQCVAVGRYDEAIAIYEELLAANPQADLLHLLRGHALKTVGRLEDAISAYQAAYQARDDFGDAYWSLANLKTYSFDEDEIQAMRMRAEQTSVSVNDKVHLRFALGKAFEDSKDYAAAFEHYSAGNALKREQLNYDSKRMRKHLRLQEEICTREFFAEREGWGAAAADPIFVVGLPRAGSTLLEQILASHSQIDGTFELANIGALAHRLEGRRMRDETPKYPARLLELSEQQTRDAGQRYIDETTVHRQGAAFFIDKMPNNFRHIGLIHMILPNAKIIDARRHPMACCFSGFKQLFASGQEFSYSLADIGNYYADYVRLMDHWDNALPGRVLRVNYEHVVDDLETQVHRILAYCGLDFEQACVDFHKTSRSIRTPSSEQVRQPIYQSGLEQWRRFDAWLPPLQAALGDQIDRYERETA